LKNVAIIARICGAVIMGTGQHDPIIPLESAERLAGMLKEHGADVTMKVVNAGHGLAKA